MANKRNLQPALDAAQNQLGLTFGASDSLDTKALGILGFNVALVLFALQSEMNNPWWLLSMLFVVLFISSLTSIYIIWPRSYFGAIVDPDSHPEYLQLSEEELVLQLLADTQKAVDLNSRKNRFKSNICIVCIVLSLAGVGLLAGCIL